MNFIDVIERERSAVPIWRSLVVIALAGVAVAACLWAAPPASQSEAGIEMNLPSAVDGSRGSDQKVSESERLIHLENRRGNSNQIGERDYVGCDEADDIEVDRPSRWPAAGTNQSVYLLVRGQGRNDTNLDMLLDNINHRWVYVIVSSPVPEGFVPQGKNTEQTLELLKGFISKLAPPIIKPHAQFLAGK